MNYDVIIIGGGPGGYKAAAIASARGEKVLLVERDNLGGTCLNRGCIPTKCLCRSAQIALDVASAANFGIEISGQTQVSLPVMVSRKDEVVERLRESISMIVAAACVVTGTARIVAPGKVEVTGISRITCGGEVVDPLPASLVADAPKIIIATGSEAASLDIPGASLAVTSTEMLSLRSLPVSLVVIGGGVIGLEFASVFAALGSEVTVIEYCKEVLPQFDKDIAKRLRTVLQKRGVRFHTSSAVTSVSQGDGLIKTVAFTSKGKEQNVSAEQVLMAVGRRPVVPEGTVEAGVKVGPRGIEVDARFATSVPGIYAIGDCNGVCQLAHAAYAQARMVMGGDVDLSVIPSAVFTVPECAMVGITEEQCRAQEIQCKVGKAFFRANGKALAMGEDEGLVKIIVDDGGMILGCHICGPHAADLIAEVALAMSARIPVSGLVAAIHSHPTLSEAVLQAAASVC